MPVMLPPPPPPPPGKKVVAKHNAMRPPPVASRLARDPPRPPLPTTTPSSPGSSGAKRPSMSKLDALKLAVEKKKHMSGGQPPGASSTSELERSSASERIPPLVSKYSVPAWSCDPQHDFHLEVLKSGSIIDDIALESAHTTVGRHPAVGLTMENPSISRQHAVFQFRDDGHCYLYDLGSTHGSFINKQRISPSKYYQLNVGDVIKFGSSSRLFIFQGPSELQPEEYTSDRLRQLRLKSQLRSARVSSKVKRALINMGANGDDDGGAAWGFDEDAVEVEDDEEDYDDEFDEHGKRTKKVEITREMLGEKDMKVFEKMQRNRAKVKNLQLELGRIRSKEDDQGGEFTEGQLNTMERNEKHIAQLLESIADQEDLLRERIGLRNESRQRAANGGKHRPRRQVTNENDDEDDDFYDRTGQKQVRDARRRRLRHGAVHVEKKKALSLDELKAKSQELEDEKSQLMAQQEQLAAEGLQLSQDESSAKEASDPLLAYMHKTRVEANKSGQDKISRRLAALAVEEMRNKQLLTIVAPALNGLKQDASRSKQTEETNMEELESQDMHAHKKEEPKTQKEKLLAHARESGANVPWLQKMAKDEQAQKEAEKKRRDDRAKERQAVAAKAHVLGPRSAQQSPRESALPAQPQQKVGTASQSQCNVPIGIQKRVIQGPVGPPAPSNQRDQEQEQEKKVPVLASERHAGSEGSSRRARRRKRPAQPGHGNPGHAAPSVATKKPRQLGQKDNSALEGGDVAWTPPINQDGSGKTALNDKYGY